MFNAKVVVRFLLATFHLGKLPCFLKEAFQIILSQLVLNKD